MSHTYTFGEGRKTVGKILSEYRKAFQEKSGQTVQEVGSRRRTVDQQRADRTRFSETVAKR